MDLATQPVTEKNRDAYYWRLLATAASFALFGLGGLCLRVLVFPVLGCLPGDALKHRQRARQTVSRLFWFFVRFMARTGVLTYDIQGAERLGRPGQMIIANHPSLIDVVFLIGLVRQANCVVKKSLWENPFTRGNRERAPQSQPQRRPRRPRVEQGEDTPREPVSREPAAGVDAEPAFDHSVLPPAIGERRDEEEPDVVAEKPRRRRTTRTKVAADEGDGESLQKAS